MALYENQSKVKPGTRSNTKLVVSGGFSPAEQFIVDPELPVVFNYEYGGAGQKDVVIPKGAVVGIKPEAEIDPETGKTKSVLTYAGKDGAKAVGVAPYNYTKHNYDKLDGNLPAIITREYIELPFGTDKTKVGALQFGAVHAEGLSIGDLVTYGKAADGLEGKVVKAVDGDEIIGQVLAMEADAQVQGWLKWVLWDEAAKNEDLGSDRTGYEAPGRGGYPFDPEYAEGTIDIDGYLSQYTSNPTGIPGLLDGRQRSLTERKQIVDLVAGVNTVELLDQDLVEGSVAISGYTEVTSDVLAAGEFRVDHKAGIVSINASADTADVVVNYKANAYGTPAHLDFDGVLGACRILLRF
jgi:hypothetical protein